jgi:hypothetical protein
MRWIVPVIVVVVVSFLLGLVYAWSEVDFDLEYTSKIGDSLAPVVGIFSLVAVGAALWSIKLQRTALDNQETEIKQQGTALDRERTERQHEALRDAYGPWMSAVDEYLDEVDAYSDWLRKNIRADRRERRDKQAPVHGARVPVDRTVWVVRLLEADDKRQEDVYSASREIELEPEIQSDSEYYQLLWLDVLRHEVLEGRAVAARITRSLRIEFKRPTREPAESAVKVLAEAKAEAEKAHAAIAEDSQRRAAAIKEANDELRAEIDEEERERAEAKKANAIKPPEES